jgi:Interleukin-like EMT inducer
VPPVLPGRRRSPGPAFGVHLGALLAYLFLAIILTYPLILRFGSHVAGDGSDDPALAWNLWWVRYAIFDLGRSPIYTDYLSFPIGLNLAFYTLTYLNALVSIPVQFAFGLIPAANVNLILSYALGGFGTYLLVEHLLSDVFPLRGEVPASNQPDAVGESEGPARVAAFAAGLLYTFSSNKFLYASLGQFNIASSQWIPFYILFLLKIFPTYPRTRSPSLRDGFLLGLFLLFQALSELTFASFLILFTVAYLIYWLITNRSQVFKEPSSLRFTFYSSLLAAITFLVPMLPIFAAIVSDMRTEGDYLQQGLGFSNSFSADLLGFFIPSQLHPLFGGLEAQFHFAYTNFVYLGYVALALACVALLKVPKARIWGLSSGLIFLITLGPTLRVDGSEFNLPFLPFNALLRIPIVEGNRYPSRWSVMLTLCLAVLVGYGAVWLLKRVQGHRFRVIVPPALCMLLMFEHLSIPLPTSDLRVPAVYSKIGGDPGSFTVLELPLAWRNGFRVTGSYRADSQAPIDRVFMLAQWYQTAQQHPILNGNTSRNPELKFQYFAESPLLDSLIAIQEGHSIDEAIRARDKQLAPRLLQFFNIRYVVWHAPMESENRDVANRTRAYAEAVLPMTKIAESYENGRGLVLYRVDDQPPAWNDYVIDGNSPLARLFFGEGWGAVGENTMWVTRQAANIFLPLDSPHDTRVTFEAFSPIPQAGQGVTVRVNEQFLGHYQPIPLSGNAFSVIIPASLLRTGANEMRVEFDRILPYDRLSQPPLSIVVRSAGEEQGDFGHVYVDGVDESPNARGYNVVVIDPRTGAIDAKEHFDTFASEQESERMAQFIAGVPEGKIVAAAVRDEGSQHLTQAAVEALKSLGSKLDLRGKFRWSHALLATKGKPAGTLEAASETDVSQVFNAEPVTEPNVAATVGAIRIQPQ